MPVYGYARVSTDGQTLDGQIADLKASGAEKVFREKVSGARADRPELARMMRTLAPGDRVLVTRLDRLARSTRDLLNILPRSLRSSQLSLSQRCVGRHDHAAWATDADGAGRAGRVRARADPGQDRRGAGTGQSARRTARTQAEADAAPAARGGGPS